MIEIQVFINGRTIGQAVAYNRGGPEEACSYKVRAVSQPSPVTCIPHQSHRFVIDEHNRVQSAWALVARIAEEAAKREAATPPVSTTGEA